MVHQVLTTKGQEKLHREVRSAIAKLALATSSLPVAASLENSANPDAAASEETDTESALSAWREVLGLTKDMPKTVHQPPPTSIPPPHPTAGAATPPKPSCSGKKRGQKKSTMAPGSLAFEGSAASVPQVSVPSSAPLPSPGHSKQQEQRQRQEQEQQQQHPQRDVPSAKGTVWPRRNPAAATAAAAVENETLELLVFEFTVRDAFVRHIIVKQGAVIKRLQEQTNCKIVVPPKPDQSDPQRRTLSLSSTSAASCEAAAAEIVRIVQQVHIYSYARGNF